MRILLITSDVPATSSMPGSPRAYSFFRYLAMRHKVDLATFTSSSDRYSTFLRVEETRKVFQTITLLPSPQTTTFWGRQFHRLAQAPYFFTRYRSPAEFHFIRRRIGELIHQKKPNLVFVDRLEAGQYILDFRGLPRIVDAHDAVSLNFRRAAGYANCRLGRFRLLCEAVSIRRFELATARAVDAYLVNSKVDQRTLQSYDPDINVQCIPNGVDAEYFAPNDHSPDERTLVFTGVMSYAPNRDAAHFLCGEILPRIKHVIPNVRILVVGSKPPQDVLGLGGNGVTVTGTVPDVRPYVQRATVYVSPLRFGTGVKNKILAALAMGKAVVATSASCEGLDLTPGKHLLVADNAADFATHIVCLLGKSDLRRQLGLAGRELVLKRYRWDVVGMQLETLLQSLVFPIEQPE